MDAVIYFIGYTTISLLVMASSYVAIVLGVDAIRCAQFVYRYVSLAGFEGNPSFLRKAKSVFKLWWVYFFGIRIRPNYSYDDQGNKAYWPGKEPQ